MVVLTKSLSLSHSQVLKDQVQTQLKIGKEIKEIEKENSLAILRQKA